MKQDSTLPEIRESSENTRDLRESLKASLRELTASKEQQELLEKARADLEKRVEERTHELAQERQSLEEKVNERTQELRDSLRQIEETNTRLIEANQHKSRFLSSMSHELRTPLNAILGFADLLFQEGQGLLSKRHREYVEHISYSGQHLLDLISDLLDIAKVDAGAMFIQLELLDAYDAVQETVAMMRAQFQRKSLTVKTLVDPKLRTIPADKRRFRQIMFNLLSNAVKYSPIGGEIEISAIKQDLSTARISISDNGIGIEPAEIERIFLEFHQADRKRDEALGGTGIGLALTRRLVELHGGQIGVHSQVGAGSSFWFTLPFKEAKPKAHTPELAKKSGSDFDLKGRRILLAEDNEVNVALMLAILGGKDIDVDIARNGKEALEHAQAHRPDLVLMDIRMPVMDGLEATHRIREAPELANLPIIALTASVSPESIQECLDAGCNEHLSKPVQARHLFSVLAKYL